MVSTSRNYARNDNSSPCRRKYGAVLKQDTRISLLQLRKYKKKQHGHTVEEGFDVNSQGVCILLFP